MQPEITSNGFIVGALVWLVLIIGFALSADCLNYKNCGAGDMILLGLGSASMLAPAYIVALVVSGLAKKK